LVDFISLVLGFAFGQFWSNSTFSKNNSNQNNFNQVNSNKINSLNSPSFTFQQNPNSQSFGTTSVSTSLKFWEKC